MRQGEVYWYDGGEPSGSAPGLQRPWVVIQNDAANDSRLATTMIVAITSTRRLASEPGNVTLSAGEAGLPRQSVAIASQIQTVDKRYLTDYAGELSSANLHRLLRGVWLYIEPREPA